MNLPPEEAASVNIYQHLFKMNSNEPSVALTRQFFAVTTEEVPKKEEIKNSNCRLLMHLRNFRNRRCGDPRDKIFGVRALACDINKDLILPEYDDSVALTFAKACKVILEQYKTLDLLSMSQGPLWPASAFDKLATEEQIWPSWLPSFGVSNECIVDGDLFRDTQPLMSLTNYMTNYMTNERPYYTATLDSKAEPLFSADVMQVTLSGYRVATIKSLVALNVLSLLQARNQFETDAIVDNESEQGREEAFWRTLISNRSSTSKVAKSETEGAAFNAFCNFYTGPDETTQSVLQQNPLYQAAFLQHGLGRSFFTTHCGLAGLAPLTANVGDAVCLLAGGQVPFILRKVDQRYQMVGETYVHGIMNGAKWMELEHRDVENEDFVLF